MADTWTADAFGELIFLGTPAPPPRAPERPAQARALPSSKPVSVFTLPVRSKGAHHVKCHPCSDLSIPATSDVLADAMATVVVGALPTPRTCSQDEGAAHERGSARAPFEKSKTDVGSSGRFYTRTTSLDTTNPLLTRDQSSSVPPQDSPSPTSPNTSPHLTTSSAPYDGFSPLHTSPVPAPSSRRSGSCASSGGGAPPAGHPGHHGVWHSNTEWWRSFSSSRLNELAVEEPDKRSPEMRKVPYTGGAEPMYALVHGAGEQ